ncbi:hypothetical protein KCV07_g3780, partial [Aureobasidium melanogenum]
MIGKDSANLMVNTKLEPTNLLIIEAKASPFASACKQILPDKIIVNLTKDATSACASTSAPLCQLRQSVIHLNQGSDDLLDTIVRQPHAKFGRIICLNRPDLTGTSTLAASLRKWAQWLEPGGRIIIQAFDEGPGVKEGWLQRESRYREVVRTTDFNLEQINGVEREAEFLTGKAEIRAHVLAIKRTAQMIKPVDSERADHLDRTARKLRQVLAPVDTILYKGRSAVAEGDVFAVLAHSPSVVRSFEFGLADGAIDCTHSYDVKSSYAYRLWKLDQGSRMPNTTSAILLFDVKSAVVDQCYIATNAQRKHVAFYIGICAADPTFVELIPNYGQGSGLDQLEPATSQEDNGRYLSVNVDRHCRLPLKSYGINQTNAPYRMPIALLVEAVARVRLCAQGHGVYVNPWTLVEFPHWKPTTTEYTHFLKPAAGTANYTAYDAAQYIYQAVMSRSDQTSMTLDYVGLQPRLADFKLLLHDPLKQTRQVYIQHKIDPRVRSKSDRLSKVTVVSRRRGKKRGFDFLFFQFVFSNQLDPTRHIEFLFLPEHVIPDSFYVSSETELSLDRPEFLPYRIHMDEDGEWVTQMHRIVQQEDRPQKPGQRPLRSDVSTMEKEQEDGIWDMQDENNGQSDQEQHGEDEGPRGETADTKAPSDVQAEQAREGSSSNALPTPRAGYGDFAVLMEQGQIRFFNEVMRQCAERLDSSAIPRLVAYDMLGQDAHGQPLPLVIIPSEDIGVTTSQQKTFADRAQEEGRIGYTPTLSALLKHGLYAGEYGIGSSGPLIYDDSSWTAVWRILDSFTLLEEFHFPLGQLREPHLYRTELHVLHERLSQEYYHATCKDKNMAAYRDDSEPDLDSNNNNTNTNTMLPKPSSNITDAAHTDQDVSGSKLSSGHSTNVPMPSSEATQAAHPGSDSSGSKPIIISTDIAPKPSPEAAQGVSTDDKPSSEALTEILAFDKPQDPSSPASSTGPTPKRTRRPRVFPVLNAADKEDVERVFGALIEIEDVFDWSLLADRYDGDEDAARRAVERVFKKFKDWRLKSAISSPSGTSATSGASSPARPEKRRRTSNLSIGLGKEAESEAESSAPPDTPRFF